MNRKIPSFAMILLITHGLLAVTYCGESAASDRRIKTPRLVTIVCEAPGMSAEDVETHATYPLEVGLMGISGVRRISAVTRMGKSVISVEFDQETAINRARQLVAEKVEALSDAEALQKDVKIKLAPMASGRFVLVALSLDEVPVDIEEGNTLATQMRDVAEDTFRQRLVTISGVSQVTVIGGMRRQCEVTLSPEKVAAYGLTGTDILNALGKANTEGAERVVRNIGQVQSVADIENTVLAIRDEKPILVKDVADVRVRSVGEFDGDEQETQEKTMPAAKRGVVLAIALQPNVDVTELGKNIDAVLEVAKAALPTGVKVGRTIDARLEPLVDETQRVLRQEFPPEMELEREKSDTLGDTLVVTADKRSVVKLFGPDLAVLQRTANKCRRLIAQTPGVVDLRVEARQVAPELIFRLDRKAIARHGIAIHDVLDECRLAMDGQKTSTVNLNDRPCDLVVINPGLRDAPRFADKIRVRAKNGELIPLVRLVDIHIKAVPRSIHSEDTVQVLRVSFNTKDRNMADIRAAIRTEVEKTIAPVQEILEDGYRIQFGWK